MPVIKNNFRGWSTSIHSYLSTSGSLCGQHEEKRRVNNQVRHIGLRTIRLQREVHRNRCVRVPSDGGNYKLVVFRFRTVKVNIYCILALGIVNLSPK